MIQVKSFQFLFMHHIGAGPLAFTSVADTGGLQWFQLKPPLKEPAPLIRDDWYREEQKSP